MTTWRHIDPAAVFEDHVEDIKLSKDPFAWGCCPFHNDTNPSFSMNYATGAYKCYSSHCAVHGNNIVSFVSALQEISWHEARQYVEVHYG